MKLRVGWIKDGVGYIPLTQEKLAKVDPEDLEKVSAYNWYASFWVGGKTFYAANRSGIKGDKSTIKMHRFVLGVTDPKIDVDHINHDTLDNRKSNLRSCTHEENNRNCLISSNNKTGFKGVSFEAQTGRYKAQITVRYKPKNLGRYDTPEEAHQAYLEAAKAMHGEFACSGRLPNA